MNRPLVVEVVKKASQETGLNWTQSTESIQKKVSNRNKGTNNGQGEGLHRTTNISMAETKDSQIEEIRVKNEEWIRARLQRNLKTRPRSLNFTLHVTRSVFKVFTLWCEKVSVKTCKILFTQSISRAQIFLMKHRITGRKRVRSPGTRAYY